MSYNEELQSNNDALRGILDEVNALPNGTGGAQADWNQSDPAARDYIKNRPFYDDEKWRIAHEVRQFVSTESGFDWIIGSDNIFHNVPVGTKCRIVVDGATYIGTMADEHEGTGYYSRYIGNGYLKDSDLPDTGEPFVFFASGLDCMAMIPCDTMPSAATISVLEIGELVRIDPKFLPEPVQDDWHQNDPSAPDYIKNRPFYAESDRWVPVFENIETGAYSDTSSYFTEGEAFFSQYPSGTTVRFVIDGREYVGPITDGDHVGNLSLCQPSLPDTGEKFCLKSGPGVMIVAECGTPGGQYTVSVSVLEPGAVKTIDPKFLPEGLGGGKPLILDASSSDYYGGHPEAGDEALEAIKTGRQILVRVPNASGDSYVASYSPVYFVQLPLDGQYLYLFYLRDEKQDLSALLGQPAGTVVMPTYGQLMMLLSQHYDSNPLEG